MASISENPLAANISAGIKASAREGLEELRIEEPSPQRIIKEIDEFVFQWQQGNRPQSDAGDMEVAPYMMGSLWGEQLVARFGWEWVQVTFHDHRDSKATAVASPDRALAVYPFAFLIGCFKNPHVDCTIALAYNMMEAGTIARVEPGEYFNLMDGVHRIVPRI